MSAKEYVALAVFAATVIGVSFLDADMALGLVVIVGVVIVVTTMGV